MKKVVLPIFSCLLVLTLLLGSFGSAKAAAGDDPTVTPVSGDLEFTTEIIPIVNLPGVTELANHMLAPIGFPAGEAQFGGNGIRVSKMDSGKATVCFSLSTVAVQQGWGGKVGVWNGTKWVKLATTIATSTDETATTLACAPITGNGTYAFIKYVADASLLPLSSGTDILPTCGSIGIIWDGHGLGSYTSSDPYWVRFLDFDVTYPDLQDTLIQYQIINANVPFTGDLHGSVITNSSGRANFSGFTWRYDGSPITSLIFTIRVVTPVCYDDFEYDWSWALPEPE